MATVLVVDDEVEVTLLMGDFLRAEGFQVLTANRADEALAILRQNQVDCLLLDVMMPGISGFDLCRTIRAEQDLPVLFLSARDGDADKIRGLMLGADDYVVKSATPSEVVARIRAVLRRVQRGQAGQAPAVLDFGRLVIDLRAHEVRVDGVPVPFTAKEFEVLRLLAEHPRQLFSRDQIFARIWGSYGDPQTVRVHIGRIREKIEADPDHPQYIVTVWGVGYRFEGVRR
jgi:DNA-binding response OmpR family regulator